MGEYQEKGSGYALTLIENLTINFNKYSPIKGSNHFDLPPWLRAKKACANVNNKDVYCFEWVIIAHFFKRDRNAYDVSRYNIPDISADYIAVPGGRQLNFMGLSFPLKLKQIRNFEENNPDISIGVATYDDKDKKITGPAYRSKERKQNHINLLLAEKGDRKHFVLIRDIEK